MVTPEDLNSVKPRMTMYGVVNLIKNIPKTKVAILFIEETDARFGPVSAPMPGCRRRRLAALFGGGVKKAGGFPSLPTFIPRKTTGILFTVNFFQSSCQVPISLDTLSTQTFS